MRSRVWIPRTITTVVVLSGLLLVGCADDKNRTTEPESVCEGDLVFTREDSTTVEFPPTETYVWCANWEGDTVPVPAIHVQVLTTSPPQLAWSLRAVLDDVILETPMSFPNYFVWDQPDSVAIFLLDVPNELATDQPDAGGSITFHRVPCPTGDRIEFTIDATLGSELASMPTVHVCGEFSGTVTGPPRVDAVGASESGR